VNARLVVNEERSVAIAVKEVTKEHGRGRDGVVALDRVSVEVRRGEFVCIVGASGCGKSTLLHLIAGLERPSAGSIGVSGGGVSIMFQDPALFPWLSVEQNVEFPLVTRGVAKAERRAKVDELLGLVRLQGFAKRQPHELSGGMRQRVALARALANASHVLLMDEPFAALDALTRLQMQDLVGQLLTAHSPAVLLVTHDVDEAIRLGDRILVLRRGTFGVDLRVDPSSRDRGDARFLEYRRLLLSELGVRTGPVKTG
jgi:NitT/TauT family transport system ATP-binding protein